MTLDPEQVAPSALPKMWRVPKIRGIVLGCPNNNNPHTLGSILGSPIFGKSLPSYTRKQLHSQRILSIYMVLCRVSI